MPVAFESIHMFGVREEIDPVVLIDITDDNTTTISAIKLNTIIISIPCFGLSNQQSGLYHVIGR